MILAVLFVSIYSHMIASTDMSGRDASSALAKVFRLAISVIAITRIVVIATLIR